MTRGRPLLSQSLRRNAREGDGTVPVDAIRPPIRVTPVEGGHGGLMVTCSRCPNARVLRASEQDANAYAVRHLASPGCGHRTAKAAA